jgi:hypothetical protein
MVFVAYIQVFEKSRVLSVLGAQSAVIGLLAGPLESKKYPIVVNMFCKIQSLYRIVP